MSGYRCPGEGDFGWKTNHHLAFDGPVHLVFQDSVDEFRRLSIHAELDALLEELVVYRLVLQGQQAVFAGLVGEILDLADQLVGVGGFIHEGLFGAQLDGV